MYKSILLIALTCVCFSQGFFWNSGPRLNDVRVKFDLNPLKSFYSMPKTRAEAEKGGFLRKLNAGQDPTSCVTQYEGGIQFNGFRYKDSDAKENILYVLYDGQGTIAGIQACWPYSQMFKNASNDLDVENISSYQCINDTDGAKYACQTAYFVDPSTICSTGRSSDSLKTDGTALGLWFQWGPTPTDTKKVPMNRADASAEKWSDNNCFAKMGTHNFYNVESYSDTDCRQIHGYFNLYDKDDQLRGFGFRTQGTCDSKYVEQPDQKAIKMIQGCAPKCIIDKTNAWGTTTMHVYFTKPDTFTECSLGELDAALVKSRIVNNSSECVKNGKYSSTP